MPQNMKKCAKICQNTTQLFKTQKICTAGKKIAMTASAASPDFCISGAEFKPLLKSEILFFVC